MNAIVACNGISKIYPLYKNKTDRIKEFFHPGRKTYHQDFFAIKDIDLELAKGQSLAIIGRNGSGKSTLLKIICGVTTATSGTLSVSGRMASLLELGAGFHPELTGVENVYLHGLLRGIKRDETKRRLESILDFAGIGAYAEQPVKTYSSGMFVRLAFSAEVHSEPEILIVDEALSVGDASFQIKCIQRMQELSAAGVSLLFVSHDASIVRTLCDHAILLDRGKIAATGNPMQVYDIYNGMIGLPGESAAPRESFAERSGTGDLQFARLWVENAQGVSSLQFRSGETVRVCLEIKAIKETRNPTVGISFRDRNGQDMFGINSALLRVDSGIFKTGEVRRATYEFPLNFGPGIYSLSAALHQFEIHTGSCYDWINHALSIQVDVDPAYRFSGYCRIVPVFRLD
ncbi:MAG: ABC transporter ATP-binding protein [Spirochaetia bacterium]|nr:ABC transporter ATP-binding protein [Spirochaetia bacterium]